jgi:hypothetical protein
MRQDFTVHGPLEVDVKLGMGRVDTQIAVAGAAWAAVEPVNPSHEPSVQLAAQASISLDGDRLRISVPESGRLFRRGEVAITLCLPAASAVLVKGGAVDVTVVGGVDALTLKLGAGEIDVDEATSSLVVKAGQTDVRVGSSGAVAVTTGQGSLTANRVGDAVFKSGQGSVQLGRTEGTVTVKGGSVDLDVAEAAAGQVSFTTGSGSARVGVAAGTSVELDLMSASGDVRCDLPMESAAPAGGTGLRVRLHTASGNLRVAPATPATV